MSTLKADRLARFVEKTSPEGSEGTLEEMFQRMTTAPDGVTGVRPEGLPAVCAAWDVPYGRVLAWLMADVRRYAMYQRALEVAAHQLVAETVDIADEGDAMTVQRDRLRIATRFQVARAHAPKLYGEQMEVKHTGEITMSMALAQIAAKRLREGTLRIGPEGVSDVEPIESADMDGDI
jgi:hypothetical protein